MAQMKLPETLSVILKKYKYPLLILMLGVGLLLLPGKTEKTETVKAPETDGNAAYVAQVEGQLEELLSLCEGAGEVRVMLTLEQGSRTEYQTDVQTTGTGEERKTVILSEGSAYDKAAVATVSYPRFQGALILCQGGENPEIQLKLVRAVAALTGLGTNQITVIKMKSWRNQE